MSKTPRVGSRCIMLGCETGLRGAMKRQCFPFPTSEVIRNQWIQTLGHHQYGRENFVLKPFHRVCDKHFHESCFLSFWQNFNSKGEPRKLRRLRENAVPSICLPDGVQRVKIDDLERVYDEHNYWRASRTPPDVNLTDIQMEVTIEPENPLPSTSTSSCKNCASRILECEKLSKENKELTYENEKMRKFITGLAEIFNQDQLAKLMNPEKKLIWSTDTLKTSLKLYNKSWSAYEYLKSLGYPIPSLKTIMRVKAEGVSKVAVVTGASKGVGLAVVKSLAKSFKRSNFKGDVYLTARTKECGEKIVQELEELGLDNVHCHALDVTDEDSIEDFAYFLRRNYGGLNVLVNNAAIEDCNDAQKTLETNYFGVKKTCDILFRILRNGARVVNVTRNCGLLYRIPSNDLKAVLKSESLTVEQLDELMHEFVEASKDGSSHVEKGWPDNAYIVSKVGLAALTRIQQRMLDKRTNIKDVAVNHVHPGSVEYDPENQVDSVTFENGVKSCVFAATLPVKTDVKGAFIWKDCSILDWAEMSNEPEI